jgi:hypothetical protein
MSEETQEQEGTMSGLKKTLIGAVGTIVTAGGVWAASLLGGDKAEPAPVQAAPVINITNSQTQQQAAGGGKTVIIKEKETVKEPAKPVKKKDGDEFKEEAPKW